MKSPVKERTCVISVEKVSLHKKAHLKRFGNSNMEPRNDAQNIYEKYSFLLTEETLPQRKDIILNELGYLTRNLEDFILTTESDVRCNLNIAVPKLSELIVSFGLVKAFQGSEDRDYDSKDFPFEAQNAEQCFECLNYLLVYYKNIDTSSKRKFLVQVLLLCATHNKQYFWSNEKSVGLSNEFIKNLLKCSNYKGLNNLLCDDTFHPTIFKGILKWMRPFLMKDTWMKNPSSCHVFHWLLSHVKHPFLIDYLNDVLPPSFMFSNYYAVPQQVLGIQCFYHILDNVPPSYIKADGIEDAIFDNLRKYIYSKEIPIVEVLYPCLLKLPMMNLQMVNHMHWFQFDIVLQQLLLNVDMESNVKLRHLFLTQAYLFLKTTPCFKHLKKTLHILLQNFIANSIAEEECRVVSLKIIKQLIRSCWPRMEHHCLNIMHAILKALYDVENPSYTANEALSKEILSLCEDCLHLLKLACPETFTNLASEYIQGDGSLPGVNLLRSII